MRGSALDRRAVGGDDEPLAAHPLALHVAGVDKSLLGTITVDGVKQATINHRPLYYFASDSAAGDVQGQGVGGKWFVVAADGKPVEG